MRIPTIKGILKNEKALLGVVLVFLFSMYVHSISPFPTSNIYFFDNYNTFKLSDFSRFDNLSNTDNLIYVTLGKSIAEGKGYRDIYHPDDPEQKNFPFMFPLMLASIILFFGINFFALKVFVSATAIMALYFLYELLSKNMGEKNALLVVLLTGFSISFFLFAIDTFSEIPFILFSVLSLIFLEKYSVEEKLFGKNLVFLSALLLLAFFTRYVGLALIIGGILFLLAKRSTLKEKAGKIIPLLAITLPIVWLWFWRNSFIKYEPFGYTPGFINLFGSSVEFIMDTVNYNIVFYMNAAANVVFAGNFFLAQDLFPEMGRVAFTLRTAVVFAVTALVLYSLVKRLLKNREPLEFYLIVYFAVLLAYPFPIERLIIPIIPFIFYYFTTGFLDLLAKLGNPKLKTWVFAIVVFFIAISNFHYISIISTNNSCHYCAGTPVYLQATDITEMGNFVNSNGKKFVVSTNPVLIYLFGEKQGFLFPVRVEFDTKMEFDRDKFLYKQKDFPFKFNPEEFKKMVEQCGDDCAYVFAGREEYIQDNSQDTVVIGGMEFAKVNVNDNFALLERVD